MSTACQVDFYVLARTTQSAEQLACRLAMMAWEQGHRVAVCTASDPDARRLDELMWDDPPGRFLPHATGADETGRLGIDLVLDRLHPGFKLLCRFGLDHRQSALQDARTAIEFFRDEMHRAAMPFVAGFQNAPVRVQAGVGW
mgnify:CR=1 FL=1